MNTKTSGFQEKLMKYMMPVAHAVEKNNWLQAIKDGMIANIPVIIIGSVSLLPIALNNLFAGTPISDFLSRYMGVLTYASTFTNDVLSIYAAFFIASALAKRYGIQNSQTGVTAIIVHLILAAVTVEGNISVEFLGASGLFVSIISGIMSVEITRFLIKKNVIIKLPDSVPSMVGESFAALIPLAVNVIAAVAIANVSVSLSGLVFPAAVMKILAPAITTMDSLPALLIVIFLTQLLWFFGLHGPSITSAVWAAFAIAYQAENITNYGAGAPVTHIFTYGLYYNFLQVSGSGLTLGLVFMMLRSKSRSFKSIGMAAIVPSIFGINEPVIFGLPILLNPYMFIPFVFGPLLVTLLTYFSMTAGFVGYPVASPPGFLPPGIGAFLTTYDWRSVVLVILSLVIMGAIYYPFFKMMEKEELKKEAENEVK